MQRRRQGNEAFAVPFPRILRYWFRHCARRSDGRSAINSPTRIPVSASGADDDLVPLGLRDVLDLLDVVARQDVHELLRQAGSCAFAVTGSPSTFAHPGRWLIAECRR
jgi:hypothetical protein